MDQELIPFYQLHRRRYSTYWDLYTPQEWEAKKVAYADEIEAMRRLEAATVAFANPGDAASEEAANLQSERPARPGGGTGSFGRRGRGGRSWFSYDLAVDPAHPMALILTFYSDDRRSAPGTFDILVDGERVAVQEVGRGFPRRFYDVTHAIPAGMVEGKAKVTVRFQPQEGSQISTIYGVRMVRADEVR
jgi:hypothetical protein